MSIAVAAVAAGVSASQLSHIERGQSRHSRWFAWHSDDPDLHEDDRGRVYVHPVLDDFRRGRCDADVRGPSTWVCNLPVHRLKHIAPGIRIVLELPAQRTRSRLDEGRLGLFVTPQEFASPRHPVVLLFAERHGVVGCADNPALAERRMIKNDFLALDHVAVLLCTNVPAAFADRQLEEIGKVRQIGVTVPSFAAVLWMVVGTRRIALMHDGWRASMRTCLPIVLVPVPFVFSEMAEVIQHHRARDADPGLRWRRDQLRIEAAAD
ncbi:DNA-binding transcriptional LysR family regulator [Sphingomonas sp. UYEF23]